MNTFAQIVAGVGTRIGDTSATFANEIKRYVNFRYKEIYERYNWGTCNMSYTFDTVAGTNDYKMPDDFGKPIYVYDSTNKIDIREISIQDMERINAGGLSDSGNPLQYAQYDKINSSTQAVEQYIRFYPNPSSVLAISLPYMVWPTDLSATTDLPILDCDYEVELGATADAWRTKRQFAKAADFDAQFEQHIVHMIWRRENQPNKVVQFRPQTYNKDLLYGGNSGYYGEY